MRMLILAFEQSAALNSVALCQGDRVLAHREWNAREARNQYLFTVLPGLFEQAGARQDLVDLYAVGLGPGAFSGLRMSVAAARVMALPGGKPVTGVSSGEALAWNLRTELHTPTLTVVGDARRDRFWVVTIRVQADAFGVVGAYELVGRESLASHIPDDTTLASPDWERIGTSLQSLAGAKGIACIGRETRATADAVAALALQGLGRRSAPQAPLAPIYLHPAVFVPPRFGPQAGEGAAGTAADTGPEEKH
jgi:tRNA threonylcarbamoyl adenosine modification protein YeaZ